MTTPPATPEPTEGWGVIRLGDRYAHYYRNGDSLCRRQRLDSHRSLEPDDGPSRYDCPACREKLGPSEVTA